MMCRSVNTDITLEAGKYSVLVKVTAFRRKHVDRPEDVVRHFASRRREKLVQIGLSYDLAHTKGLAKLTEEEKREREEREERQRFLDRQRLREQTIKRLQQQHIRDKKMRARRERMMERDRLREAAAEENALHAQSDEETEDMTPRVKRGNGYGHERTDAYDNTERTAGHSATNGTNHSKQSKQSATRKVRVSSRPPLPSIKTNSTKQKALHYDEMVELLQDFEFDSDLDMPPVDSPPPLSSSTASFPRPSPPTGAEGGPEGDDPWNAVCLVGLKVFSKDPLLKLQVVKPGSSDAEAPLDRDDPAVSATFEKRASWLVIE